MGNDSASRFLEAIETPQLPHHTPNDVFCFRNFGVIVEEHYEDSFGTAGDLTMTGIKLRFKDAPSAPQEVWLYFSKERE